MALDLTTLTTKAECDQDNVSKTESVPDGQIH